MSYMKGERFSWPSSCMHVYTEMHSEIVRSKYASHLQSSTSRVWICIAEHAGECDRRCNLLQRWCDSCTQLCTGCPGGCRQALPSRHCLAQTLMQGTTGPIQPDCTQLCKLHAGHQCDTNDNNKHLCAAFCSRTDIHNFMQGKAKCG